MAKETGPSTKTDRMPKYFAVHTPGGLSFWGSVRISEQDEASSLQSKLAY